MFPAHNTVRAMSTCNMLARVATCCAHEDGGRMRCKMAPEKFTSNLMPLPKKKDDNPILEKPILEKPIPEYAAQMAYPNGRRFDELYYNNPERTYQRRYSQTWIECPEPLVKRNVLRDIEKMMDPAPIQRRPKDERPKTAESMAPPKPAKRWYDDAI